MTNILDFDSSLLNINELIIYGIKYIKNLNGLNTLYLVFNNLDGYFKKSGQDKYLIPAPAERNIVMLKHYTVFDEIKKQIELITGDKMFKYGKDFMKSNLKRVIICHTTR